MKFDWNYFVLKLTSRKFWAALIGFITAVMVMAGVDDNTITQIVALVGAFSVLIAYIIGQGLVDAAAERVSMYSVCECGHIHEIEQL